MLKNFPVVLPLGQDNPLKVGPVPRMSQVFEGPVEMVRFGQIQPNLQYQKKEGLGELVVELLGGAEDAVAVVREHGYLEEGEGEHEEDNHKLEDEEVAAPDLPAVPVLPDHEGDKDEPGGEDGQDEVGHRVVEAVYPQAQDHHHQGGVGQTVTVELLYVLHHFLRYRPQLQILLQQLQDPPGGPPQNLKIHWVGEHQDPAYHHHCLLPPRFSKSQVLLPLLGQIEQRIEEGPFLEYLQLLGHLLQLGVGQVDDQERVLEGYEEEQDSGKGFYGEGAHVVEEDCAEEVQHSKGVGYLDQRGKHQHHYNEPLGQLNRSKKQTNFHFLVYILPTPALPLQLLPALPALLPSRIFLNLLPQLRIPSVLPLPQHLLRLLLLPQLRLPLPDQPQPAHEPAALLVKHHQQQHQKTEVPRYPHLHRTASHVQPPPQSQNHSAAHQLHHVGFGQPFGTVHQEYGQATHPHDPHPQLLVPLHLQFAYAPARLLDRFPDLLAPAAQPSLPPLYNRSQDPPHQSIPHVNLVGSQTQIEVVDQPQEQIQPCVDRRADACHQPQKREEKLQENSAADPYHREECVFLKPGDYFEIYKFVIGLSCFFVRLVSVRFLGKLQVVYKQEVVLSYQKGYEDGGEIQTHHQLEFCYCLQVYGLLLGDGQSQQLLVSQEEGEERKGAQEVEHLEF